MVYAIFESLRYFHRSKFVKNNYIHRQLVSLNIECEREVKQVKIDNNFNTNYLNTVKHNITTCSSTLKLSITFEYCNCTQPRRTVALSAQCSVPVSPALGPAHGSPAPRRQAGGHRAKISEALFRRRPQWDDAKPNGQTLPNGAPDFTEHCRMSLLTFHSK